MKPQHQQRSTHPGNGGSEIEREGRFDNIPEVSVETAVKEHDEAVEGYSEALNNVWEHMHHPSYSDGKFSRFLLSDDVNTAYISADESRFSPVDFSFLNEPFLFSRGELIFSDYLKDGTEYPVAFPEPDDIIRRMGVLGKKKAVEVGGENENNGFLLCKQTFKASSNEDNEAPTLTKCLYFASVSDDMEKEGPTTHILSAASLSFEISSLDANEERRPAMWKRHALITMTVGPSPEDDVEQELCDFPFMVCFNTSKPEALFMIGESDFYQNQLVPVSMYEKEKLLKQMRPTPVFRSLGKNPELDRFMPVPHLRMYKCMRPDVQVSRWELLGHIGDLICAYAVHLQDGSADLVLARSRMVQFNATRKPPPSLPPPPMNQRQQGQGRKWKGKRNETSGRKDVLEKPQPPPPPPPPPSFTKNKEAYENEFPVLSGTKGVRKQGLVFEDVGEDDYDLDMRAMMLGQDFDLGGFSSELEDEEDSEEGAAEDNIFQSRPVIFDTMGSGSSIWGASAESAAKPWARSWLRPVMRGGD